MPKVVQSFDPVKFPSAIFQQKKVSRCSYPWEKTQVGGGFFIDEGQLSKKKSVPVCPDKLRDKGIAYEYAKLDNDTLDGKIVTGVLFRRVA